VKFALTRNRCGGT